jgi:hypothetical protein
LCGDRKWEGNSAECWVWSPQPCGSFLLSWISNEHNDYRQAGRAGSTILITGCSCPECLGLKGT